ncbi:hypothetical protein EB796_001953 [Bugula neritina]|uniref:Uncharacterized protein n=1 Tax=Bugula neritina TaxID=10212 RepID=A0A7J7KNM6_BUGNE|nr:hypothetical protein EB796_001953 [Bugula neritina]
MHDPTSSSTACIVFNSCYCTSPAPVIVCHLNKHHLGQSRYSRGSPANSANRDITLEARKTPGHTNGCMTYVWHSQKKVFCGDAILIRVVDEQTSNKEMLTSFTPLFTHRYLLYQMNTVSSQLMTTLVSHGLPWAKKRCITQG